MVDLDVGTGNSSNRGRNKDGTERLNIHRFRKTDTEVSRKKGPPPKKEYVELHAEFMRMVEDMVKELSEEKEADLEALNIRLLEVAIECFGKSRPKHRIQKAYTYDKEVRQAVKMRSVCRKQYRRASGDGRKRAWDELVKASKAWEQVRRSAQRQQADDLARAIDRER
jgi:hypothetical protein